MGWYLISVSKYGDERTCVYNFAYFAGSFLHMENDEQFFDCGRSGLCRSGSSDSSVFSERDALENLFTESLGGFALTNIFTDITQNSNCRCERNCIVLEIDDHIIFIFDSSVD